MPRRRVAGRREVLPDPIYNSIAVTKFINGMMWAGKKSVAEKIFYGAMEKLGQKSGDEPLKVFKNALDAVAPTLEAMMASERIDRAALPITSALLASLTADKPLEIPWDLLHRYR